ncbi:glycosyltransferase family 39 protein, partial [Candidatus Daviesbacteria bacterium]|nr:glycosyltransferase family 39 protein [Candidatus Daviesbacteria bacterium]
MYSKILFLILLVSVVLRLWNLGTIPPHLRNDEAALGYNAYSILQTGKDEHGQFLPFVFQSFGDFKMGLYIYLIMPFVAALGLNEFAVRLPSALAGVISVWLIYEIVKLLFAKDRLALISAFLIAVSPINIAFSRGAWEVNVSLTLTLAGIYFFLKAISGKGSLLILSALFFGLTLLTSHTAKLSTPIFVMILSASFLSKLRKINTKLILLSVLTGAVFAIPVLLTVFGGQITRLTTLSIFSYQSGYSLFQSILNRWFFAYAPSSLFINGDTNPQHTAPSTGPFLLLDIVPLIVGIITLVRAGTRNQKMFIFLGLLLLSLPSVLIIEKVNFERILPVFML